MKIVALGMAAGAVRILAALAGMFVKSKDGIALISCQGDEPSQDMIDLKEALKEIPSAPHVVMMAGRMRRSFGGAFSFLGKLYSMLRHIAGARVVVIDAYCPAVSLPKKRPGQKVVQIWHAPEAIKKFSLQILDTPAGYDNRTAKMLCMHRNYDYILCPSDATRPFFMEAFGYTEEVFVKLGQPSLDTIGRIKLLPRETRPLTFVYAPTFRDGEAVDATGLIHAFSEALATFSSSEEHCPDIMLVLKLHPLDCISALESNEKVTNNFVCILDMDTPLADWYPKADAVITDYSGVAVDAAAAGIASYYYIYDIEEYKARRGLNVDLRNEAIGKYALKDANILVKQVLSDFENGEASHDTSRYDYNALKVFADKYLEVPLSGNTQKLADFITNL